MFAARSSGRDASRGLTPSERRKPSASSSSWPGRAHGHGDRLAVDADLERLLDGQLVPLRFAVRKPQDVGSGRGVRRQGVHYDRTIDVLKLTELLPELPTERTKLLDNLGRVRREVGPVTPELSDAIADHMNIRRGEVDEVVSFYSFLGVPMDAVRVCIGPVCDCLGAKDVLAREQETRTASRFWASSASATATSRRCSCAATTSSRRSSTGRTTAPRTALAQADETLADYEARGGYEVLRNLPPNERIVEELKASGLTGYGGAGFPTGREVGGGGAGAGAALRRRQRRRRRAGDDQGPLRDGAAAPPHARGDADRHALRRGDRGLHLPAGGVRDRARPALRGARGAARCRPARRRSSRARRRRGRLHLRRGDGDARVDGGPTRDAAPQASLPERGRLPRPPDADQQRRDARAHPGDPAPRRRGLAARSACGR